MRVLYLPTFTSAPNAQQALSGIDRTGVPSSDSIGYGITASDALLSGLAALGIAVEPLQIDSQLDRNTWTVESLREFDRVIKAGKYDVVLAFHAMWPFTADLRRVMDENSVDTPLVTYTHGSHWDATDSYRRVHHPKLVWADLGNLLAADRVLVVSEAFRSTLLASVGNTSAAAAQELADRVRVTGLPVDFDRLDMYHVPRAEPPLIVFNHAPNEAKRPDVFFGALDDVLARTDASVLITRRFASDSVGADTLRCLLTRNPGRIRLGNDLPIEQYYTALWQSSIQVSTASHESLGVSTLEAIAAGNRPILPDLPAYREITENADEVIYSSSDDLIDHVVAACKSPLASAAIGQRLSQKVREQYGALTVASRVFSVLEDVVRSSNKRVYGTAPVVQND